MSIHIVYYCQNKFEPPRLDYINYYSQSIVNNEVQLQKVLNKFSTALVLIIIKKIDSTLLQIYQNSKQTFTKAKFIYIGEKEEASRAWDLDFFYFSPLPLTEYKLQICYNKYISKKGTLSTIFYSDLEGVHGIAVDDILYIQANGNYSLICIENSSNKVVSKQIQHFEKMLRTDPKFLRVNRSWIINLNKVKKLDSEILYLFGSDKLIPISKNTSTKLRSILLKSNQDDI